MYKCKVAGRITGNKLSGRNPIFSPRGGRKSSEQSSPKSSERLVGTRVRESQMTCACVRVTTSSEVVHRKHRDEKRSAKEHENQKSV